MKNKLIINFIIFVLLLLSIVFANSYVQALSKEEKLEIKKDLLEQEVKNNNITEEEANGIYKNIEQRMINCDNYCVYDYKCKIYSQNNNCISHNNQCFQRNCNYRRNCTNY